MKAGILDINGKKSKEITLPEFFSGEIRVDIVSKTLEAKKSKQPYSSSPTGGKQHSASGKLIHRRKVWKSQYGRGMSRVPRKSHSRRGSQFNWVAAEVPNTRGGRRAHPPKVTSIINTKAINKKEMRLALMSALTATANKDKVASKYENINEKDLKTLPLIVESKITSLKTKELLSGIKKILGENIYSIVEKKKKIRAGKGKMRGRRYKKNSGILIVTGNDEEIKTKSVEAKKANAVGVSDLAKGGLGRLTIYTEKALKDLEEKFSGKKSKESKK